MSELNSVAPLSEAIRLLAQGQSLAADQVDRAVSVILSGAGTEAGIAAFLTALHMKGETAEELAGAVNAVHRRAERHGISLAPPGAIDTCGTGGDGAQSLNISTAAALVVAACGVPVVKHGNRSASGNSGSSEVLTELGVAIEAAPDALERGLRELGIAFLFAPRFHPGLRHAGPVRRQLPFRTIFNLVGPLANPLDPTCQLVGVPGDRQALLIAETLARLGRRALVVTGMGGLDEVSLAGPTRVLRIEAGTIRTLVWNPEDFGLPTVDNSALRVSGPAESAQRIRDLLSGHPGPDRDTVLVNSAAALWLARGASEDSLDSALRDASETVDSGAARSLLLRWAELSHGR
ncbi:MAG: anthranilate phosphoribosyltransferase [Isosphaeraceae bacterium]